MLKANPFPRQSVNMRRLIVPASVTTETLPADVIRHNEDEVGGMLCRSGRIWRAGKRDKGKQSRGNSRRRPTLETAAATARVLFKNCKKHPLFMQASRPNRKANWGANGKNDRWKESGLPAKTAFPAAKVPRKTTSNLENHQTGLAFFAGAKPFVSKARSR